MRQESATLSLEGVPVEVRDNVEHLVILKAMSLLEPDGVAFLVLGPRFLMQSTRQGVRRVFPQAHLFLDAALALPPGTFAPAMAVGGDLLVVRRQKPSRVFIGELSRAHKQSGVLLENLTARREGKAPQLGALVDEESLLSVHSLLIKREMEKLAGDLRLPPIPLSDLTLEVNLARRGTEEAFSDVPNAVYLPLIGRSPAVHSLADLQLKPHNYAQIVLDPERATSVYAANYFNTPLGQMLRESLCIGLIPKISKSRLLTAALYLPDLATQVEVVRIHSLITDSSTQLRILQRQLWNAPATATEIEHAVRSLDPDADFVTWIESLPFPLASILWVFHAETAVRRMVDSLFDFFEALAEFTVMVMLSAFASDPAFYDEHSAHWLDTDPKHRDWIMTPSFGNWVVVGRRLAKTTRRLLSDPRERDRCLQLFSASDAGFVEMLSSKKLFGVLEEVSPYRNLWKGHGGIVADDESQRRLNTLAAALSEARSVISDSYARVMLLLPGKADYDQGLFRYEVKALMGTRVPFRKVAVTTLGPMDKRKLYMLDSKSAKPLELLPLIRFGPDPQTEPNACYFYSRLGKEGARWVSYHFDRKAELLSTDDELNILISLLTPPGAAAACRQKTH